MSEHHQFLSNFSCNVAESSHKKAIKKENLPKHTPSNGTPLFASSRVHATSPASCYAVFMTRVELIKIIKYKFLWFYAVSRCFGWRTSVLRTPYFIQPRENFITRWLQRLEEVKYDTFGLHGNRYAGAWPK